MNMTTTILFFEVEDGDRWANAWNLYSAPLSAFSGDYRYANITAGFEDGCGDA
jgi:hypothetical protein